MMTSSNESNNGSSKFCTSAAAVYYYGIWTPYICEYFNTTVPSNRKFKNAKNAKIANPRNINPAKIKLHTVCTVRVIKKVTITENRQRRVNDYPITVNG